MTNITIEHCENSMSVGFTVTFGNDPGDAVRAIGKLLDLLEAHLEPEEYRKAVQELHDKLAEAVKHGSE
jgi:hypothetical protein